MQFISGGPDLPNALLQAHEEGKVVFFCGAGISYPAGLPGFKDLVKRVYKKLRQDLSPMEKNAFGRASQYDLTLGLLESRMGNRRIAVRKAVAEVLVPELDRADARATHASLLKLARTPDNRLRLVTSNFDRIFESLRSECIPTFDIHVAPYLPLPKASAWNGLVYLHGLLPEDGNEAGLNQLVYTSGDFGKAYLTERWAARFASELFRNFTVCFVGYSIGDPVLRYMMDALAADRMSGEQSPQAYAFGEYVLGDDARQKSEWEAKGVQPILYTVDKERKNHAFLHDTLREWAAVYESGVEGRESIVVKHAIANPTDSTVQDDFVGRVMWALSHGSEGPTKRFAELVPVPPLGWLDVLSSARYMRRDLGFFVPPPSGREGDEKAAFSFLCRPDSSGGGNLMALVSSGKDGRLDGPMKQIIRWMLRHLGNQDLLLWFARNGGRIHPFAASMISDRLAGIRRFEQKQSESEPDLLSEGAPDAIPSPELRRVWEVLLEGRVSVINAELYEWIERVGWSGLTSAARFRFRELLAPVVRIEAESSGYLIGGKRVTGSPSAPPIQVDVNIPAEHVATALTLGKNEEVWKGIRGEMMDELQALLKDHLDLMRDFGQADEREDSSIWNLPSVEEHSQNRDSTGWVILMKLCRDSWLDHLKRDRKHARSVAIEWFSTPYPAFKRLALFAASQERAIASSTWLEWLLADNAWCLWAFHTKREVMRLLVLQGHRLSSKGISHLEQAILAGRPTAEEEEGKKAKDWEIWLRLTKLESSGAKLSNEAASRLRELSAEKSGWILAKYDLDEFAHWAIGSEDPGYEDLFPIEHVPRDLPNLVSWLEGRQSFKRNSGGDDWEKICAEIPKTAIAALTTLHRKRKWPLVPWKRALNVWTYGDQLGEIWRAEAELFAQLPDQILRDAGHTLGQLLKKAAGTLQGHESLFLNLCSRMLGLRWKAELDERDPVTDALNNPVGQVTEALLIYWFTLNPKDGECLPPELSDTFSRLCVTSKKQFRPARVMLASRIIALFRVDREWSKAMLLPLFDWEGAHGEQVAVWKGYLWSPRLYSPLQVIWKKSFLGTAEHCNKLGKHADQYAAVLTHAALEPIKGFPSRAFKTPFKHLDENSLQRSAMTLAQFMESLGEKAEIYWIKNVKRFWNDVWPDGREPGALSIAESLARVSIAARAHFPEAVELFQYWFVPLSFPYRVIDKLKAAGICSEFPNEALTMLDALIFKISAKGEILQECLEEISAKDNGFLMDSRFRRLSKLAKGNV